MNKPAKKPRKPREKKETKALTVQPKIEIDESIVSSIVLNGDVSKLSPMDKAKYNIKLCESLGLNPYTQPFQILKLQGREVLYATKAATEQLRKAQGVSVVSLERKTESDICIVTAIVRDAHGRTDAATGAVNTAGLRGDALANAIMKAETKAKRRATLSICGLGFLDESEIDTIPGAQAVMITKETPKREMPIVENVEVEIKPLSIEDACAELRKVTDFKQDRNWNINALTNKARDIRRTSDWNKEDAGILLDVYREVERAIKEYYMENKNPAPTQNRNDIDEYRNRTRTGD